jgi:nucleotidyltransferase substrate binding protein (TIGR01987 family)
MIDPDVRWKQRLQNFQSALIQLSEAVTLQRPLSNLEQQGFVKAFEFTHELAWNVMKDYFFYQGDSMLRGSRDSTRAAFKNGLIVDGEAWMEMIKTRNKAVHTYNRELVADIIRKTTEKYYSLFVEFEKIMEELSSED